MRDDQNKLQPLGSEQYSSGQTEQNDFYVDQSDPYLSQGAGKPQEMFVKGSSLDMGSGGVNLANKKPLIALAVIVLGGLATVFFMPEQKTAKEVQKEEKAAIEQKKDEVVKTATPVSTVEETPTPVVSAPPKALEPPPLITPKPPEPPPPPTPSAPGTPSFPTGGTISLPTTPADSGPKSLFTSKEDEEAAKRALDARRKSSIMVKGGDSDSGISGSTGGDNPDGTKGTTPDKTKDNTKGQQTTQKKDSSGFLGFGEGTLNEQTLQKTSASQVSATYLGRLDSTIAQGKIIDAVLETAVNSDLPGTLRAIVSRDVYAESGKAILIPKGSRLIGTYSVDLKPGQTRVSVVWSRLIRPDGIDLALNSPGTDTLGRAGVSGFLDDKTLLKLASAFLVSYIVPTVTNKIANVNDKGVTQTSTTNTDGSQSTTTSGGTVGSTQLQDSSKKFQEIAQEAIQDSLNTKSTIYVDQGTRINVFVNQDLTFPPQLAVQSKVVQ